MCSISTLTSGGLTFLLPGWVLEGFARSVNFLIPNISDQILIIRHRGRQLGIGNRFGTRRDAFNRFTGSSGGVNLFDKLTIDLDLDNFFWRARQNTPIFRHRSKYQFTQKIGWRIFIVLYTYEQADIHAQKLLPNRACGT